MKRLPNIQGLKNIITYKYIECEICGVKRKSLPPHVRSEHGIGAKEYKKMFGYDRNQPLECGELTEKRSDIAKEGRFSDNLKPYWREHAFKKGHNTDRNYREQFKKHLNQMAKDNLSEEVIRKRVNTMKKHYAEGHIVVTEDGSFKEWQLNNKEK